MGRELPSGTMPRLTCPPHSACGPEGVSTLSSVKPTCQGTQRVEGNSRRGEPGKSPSEIAESGGEEEGYLEEFVCLWPPPTLSPLAFRPYDALSTLPPRRAEPEPKMHSCLWLCLLLPVGMCLCQRAGRILSHA